MKRFDNPDVIITDVMDSHGKWRANKPAVICGDERISWAAFTRRINKRIREAIETSGLLAEFPEIRLGENTVGRFGELADLDDRLQAGDRVEIYRPLRADPRETRRRRAAVRARTKR